MSQMSNDNEQAVMNGDKNGYNDDYDDEEAEISNYLNQLNDDDPMDDGFDTTHSEMHNLNNSSLMSHINCNGGGNGAGSNIKHHTPSNEKALESAKDMYTIQKKVGTNLKFDYDYYCKFCPNFFSSTKEILNHLKYDHGKNFTIHECQYCMYATRYRANIHRHIQKDHKNIIGNASIPLIRKEAIITDKKLAPKPVVPASNAEVNVDIKPNIQNLNINSNQNMNGNGNHITSANGNGTSNSNTNLSTANNNNNSNSFNNGISNSNSCHNNNSIINNGNNGNIYNNGNKSDDSNPNSNMSNDDRNCKYSLRATKRDASQSESMSDYEDKMNNAKKERRLLPLNGNGVSNGQTKSMEFNLYASKINGLKSDVNKVLGNNSHMVNGHSSSSLNRSQRSMHNIQSPSNFNGNGRSMNNNSQFMGMDEDDLMMNPIENDFYEMKSNVDRLDKKLINLDTYVANMDTRITTLDTRMVRIEEKLEKILKYIEKQQPTVNK